MRPQSATITNLRKDTLISNSDVKCFNEEEVKLLFLAKCHDLKIKPKDNLEKKFTDYCNTKCVNRFVDFSDVYILINLSVILVTTQLKSLAQ
jgi:hypothetical protein